MKTDPSGFAARDVTRAFTDSLALFGVTFDAEGVEGDCREEHPLVAISDIATATVPHP
jgi:hypothetical protein